MQLRRARPVSGSADGLNPQLSQSIDQFSKDHKGTGINEGFRTNEQQQQRYNTAKQTHPKDPENWAAVPKGQKKSNGQISEGSKHERGEAADLYGIENISDEELAKYGLYRPMSWEKWHVEVIGSGGDHRADQSGPIPPEVHQVMSTFVDFLGGVGNQPYVTGVQSSVVAGQQSAVGAGVTGAAPTPDPVAGSPSGDNIGSPANGAPGAAPTLSGDASDIDRFMTAISGQESGGNYNAVNGRTGASGRFQIMPGNWPAWSKEAGLGDNAPRTPENQDLVAKFKMQQYYEQFGNWRDVAIAWYGGPGAVGYSDAAKNRKQGGGNEPSINEYADHVMRRMG